MSDTFYCSYNHACIGTIDALQQLRIELMLIFVWFFLSLMNVMCKQLAIIPDTNDSSSMAQLAAGADVLVHDCAGTIDKRHLLNEKGHSDASKCL
jgi:ribonuclease BN (tRNA processing enzyme)